MAIVIGSTSSGALGTLTLADIKLSIQSHGYGTDTTTQQTTMIRDTLRMLYGIRRWHYATQLSAAFAASIANDGIVDISTLGRGIQITSVRLTDATGTDPSDLDFVDEVQMSQLRHESLSTDRGYPEVWSRRVDSLLFYPRPQATYTVTIEYQALTTLPSADGDTIVWPETHLDVIVYGVLMRMAIRQRDVNMYDRYKVLFSEALLAMERDEADTDRQTDLEVQPGGTLSWMDVV